MAGGVSRAPPVDNSQDSSKSRDIGGRRWSSEGFWAYLSHMLNYVTLSAKIVCEPLSHILPDSPIGHFHVVALPQPHFQAKKGTSGVVGNRQYIPEY